MMCSSPKLSGSVKPVSNFTGTIISKLNQKYDNNSLHVLTKLWISSVKSPDLLFVQFNRNPSDNINLFKGGYSAN
jgi:hypothetical protein